ncbi:hypothetical protein PVK06_020698 [Gossypium arboreum]|uniref:ABC transporter domain-containing protein n=1 Tax=Gossypium arboreum TaxID=29729 RepID=A0ABR0PN28_GOSAR|nr:hypothetical protein PVK06_020698 [Gossypium arboreum]
MGITLKLKLGSKVALVGPSGGGKVSIVSQYLKGFLHGQTDKQLFKKNVLIVTYEDVKPYIDRIVSGETSDILLTKPITGFFLRHA